MSRRHNLLAISSSENVGGWKIYYELTENTPQATYKELYAYIIKNGENDPVSGITF